MSSGPRPWARTSLTYMERQPCSRGAPPRARSLRCRDDSGKPPALSNAARRNKTLVPQQNMASRPSLPQEMPPKKRACCDHGGGGQRAPVRIGVVLGRLDIGDVVVGHEAQGVLQEALIGYVVTVEDHHEGRIGPTQRIVEIARLRSVIARPPLVRRAGPPCQLGQVVASGVIEQVDPDAGPRADSPPQRRSVRPRRAVRCTPVSGHRPKGVGRTTAAPAPDPAHAMSSTRTRPLAPG